MKDQQMVDVPGLEQVQSFVRVKHLIFNKTLNNFDTVEK